MEPKTPFFGAFAHDGDTAVALASVITTSNRPTRVIPIPPLATLAPGAPGTRCRAILEELARCHHERAAPFLLLACGRLGQERADGALDERGDERHLERRGRPLPERARRGERAARRLDASGLREHV